MLVQVLHGDTPQKCLSLPKLVWYGQHVNSEVTKSLFIPVWPEGQCGVFLCRCYLIIPAVWWEFGRRVLVRQGREEETHWAVMKEVVLGYMCYSSGSSCYCCWVVKGSLTMASTWDMTCHGISQVHGFSESIRRDGSPVSFSAAAQRW